jgi:hypothetical protein
MSTPSKARWLALAVVCTGSLMNVLEISLPVFLANHPARSATA